MLPPLSLRSTSPDESRACHSYERASPSLNSQLAEREVVSNTLSDFNSISDSLTFTSTAGGLRDNESDVCFNPFRTYPRTGVADLVVDKTNIMANESPLSTVFGMRSPNTPIVSSAYSSQAQFITHMLARQDGWQPRVRKCSAQKCSAISEQTISNIFGSPNDEDTLHIPWATSIDQTTRDTMTTSSVCVSNTPKRDKGFTDTSSAKPDTSHRSPAQRKRRLVTCLIIGGVVGVVIAVGLFLFAFLGSEGITIEDLHYQKANEIASSLQSFFSDLDIQAGETAAQIDANMTADRFLQIYKEFSIGKVNYLKQLGWAPFSTPQNRLQIEEFIDKQYAERRKKAATTEYQKFYYSDLKREIRPYNITSYSPLCFVEPYLLSDYLHGFDLRSSKAVEKFVTTADNYRTAVITTPLQLPGGNEGVLLLEPKEVNTALVGHLVMNLDMSGLVGYTVRKHHPAGLVLHIFDSENGVLLHSDWAAPLSLGEAVLLANSKIRDMFIATRNWKLIVCRTDDFKVPPNTSDMYFIPAIVIGIVAVTLLVVGITFRVVFEFSQLKSPKSVVPSQV
eukprot:TRINITY_DN4449_c0_g1_i1.p1 TRINITY_DN4449_c0_g1~~TRINITY_DN4449_c0_g1_i1.p1  ORF type:complete len:564 (+),score=83.23 TRINITY_DN4449_c0_g1_i1:231-1922(+)